jgi:hypothetical protein
MRTCSIKLREFPMVILDFGQEQRKRILTLSFHLVVPQIGTIAMAIALAVTHNLHAAPITANDFVNPVLLTFDDHSGFAGGPTYPDPWLSLGVRIYGFTSSREDLFVYPYSNNAVEIDFLSPVQRVGADVLYSITTTTRLEVYNAVGLPLEHVDGVGPSFLGVDAGAALISKARFIDLPDSWSTFPVIDNLRFESVVPEPGSLAILGVGTFLAIAWGRKRRRTILQQEKEVHTLFFPRSVAVGSVLLINSVLETPPAFATTILYDASDAAIHDISSVSGGFDGSTLYVSATFRPGTLDPGNLGFLIGLDTDLNPATGVKAPAFFPLGADFTVFGVASGGSPTATARVSRVGVGLEGTVDVFFGIDAFSLAIPLNLLANDDGVANFGLAVGRPTSATGFTPTDLTVPGPVGTSGPLDGPTTPVPEPGTLTLLSIGILALLGRGRKRGKAIVEKGIRLASLIVPHAIPLWRRLAVTEGTRVCAFFVLVSVFFTSVAIHCGVAETVFEQPPDPRILAGTSSPLNFSGMTPGRRTADDFVIAERAFIHEIDWWGQHAPPSSGLDDFTFSFYADAGGLPGSPLLQTRGSVIAMPHATISGLTDYQAILDSPFGTQRGVKYWLSIFNASPGAAWRWNNSIIGNEASVQSFIPPGNEWFHVNGSDIDASFRLQGDAVPEPASMGLWLLSLAIAFCRRPRRFQRWKMGQNCSFNSSKFDVMVTFPPRNAPNEVRESRRARRPERTLSNEAAASLGGSDHWEATSCGRRAW